MFDRVFYREVRNWFVSLTRFRRYVLFISTIAVPAILGVLGAISGWNPDLRVYVVPMQITVLLFGFALGVGLFWFEEHAALVFQKFAHETQRSTDLQNEIDKQRVELIQLSAHINCLSVAARAVESALLAVAPLRAGLEETAKQLLETLTDQRAQLFGIRDEEQWNFAIYLHDGNQLTCLSHRRNFGQAGDVARSWPVGSGHVGLAYQREGELVNDDVAAEEVFQGKGDLYREYDRARYRGTASICIPDVNDDRPAIGVLVATSSKMGRYTQANVQPLRDLAQSIGDILSPRADAIEAAVGAENGKNS
jgi:putative methionine-R-sulfoxide reductase with GAF domain